MPPLNVTSAAAATPQAVRGHRYAAAVPDGGSRGATGHGRRSAPASVRTPAGDAASLFRRASCLRPLKTSSSSDSCCTAEQLTEAAMPPTETDDELAALFDHRQAALPIPLTHNRPDCRAPMQGSDGLAGRLIRLGWGWAVFQVSAWDLD